MNQKQLVVQIVMVKLLRHHHHHHHHQRIINYYLRHQNLVNNEVVNIHTHLHINLLDNNMKQHNYNKRNPFFK